MSYGVISIKVDPLTKKEAKYTAEKLGLSLSAVLKGFFDRVLTPNFAYYFKGRIPVKLLKGKKALVFISLSSPDILSYFFMGDRARRIIKKEILGFCGIKSKVYKIGNATKLTPKQMKKIKAVVKKGLHYIYN